MAKKELNVKVSAKDGLFGRVTIPPSKSYAHRMLIASMLADKPTILRGELLGDDVTATIECLETLGVKLEFISKESLKIYPIGEIKLGKVTLNVKESGSTLRFLIPIIAALGIKSKFFGKGRIKDRPIIELIESLEGKGLVFDSNQLPFIMSGKMKGGCIKIAGDVSSQYITGLLLASPLVEEEVKIQIEGDIVSRGYIDITLDVMKKFGVVVKEVENTFIIEKEQRYITPGDIVIEGDWSSACFFAAGGAINGKVEIYGMNVDSKQGDRIILDFLKQAGAKVEILKDFIRISSGELSGITFSAKDNPDIVPIMSILLSRAKGMSIIQNVERLRQKESDRLSAILEILRVFGIRAENDDDNITIYGGTLRGGEVPGFNDHRMIMSAAISAVGTDNEVRIWGAEAVAKSYPNFFRDFKNLGGKVERF